MKKLLFTVVIALTPLIAVANDFKAGEDYFVLEKPDLRYENTVIEFFSYLCPYCYRAEMPLSQVKLQLPPNMKFVRMPVYIGNKKHLISIHVWLLSNKFNFDENFHSYVLNLVNVPIQDEWSYNKLNTMQDVKKLFLDNGVSEDEYNKALVSIKNEKLIEAADDIAKGFFIAGTPSVIVRGKYLVSGMKGGLGENQKYRDLILYLVNR